MKGERDELPYRKVAVTEAGAVPRLNLHRV